jgi:peptide/nickel transport system substrate-binding protein
MARRWRTGIEVEIKSVVASVFFSSDVANLDTYMHFFCDLEMYSMFMMQADPRIYMRQFLSSEVSSKANKFR